MKWKSSLTVQLFRIPDSLPSCRASCPVPVLHLFKGEPFATFPQPSTQGQKTLSRINAPQNWGVATENLSMRKHEDCQENLLDLHNLTTTLDEQTKLCIPESEIILQQFQLCMLIP
jgi:hypothetical protein